MAGFDPDTQPHPPEAQAESEGDAGLQGPGCLTWGLVLGMVGLIGVAIVVLAGAAGWTSGKREAERRTNATLQAFADRQLPAIETNVAGLNAVQLATRVAFLATRTPGVPQVPALQTTATAVSIDVTATQAGALNEQLTAIPEAVGAGDMAQVEQRLAFLATQTPAVPEVPALQATATALASRPTTTPITQAAPPTTQSMTPESTQPAASGTFDLPALLAEAREQMDFSELEEATETLDLIQRVDPDFRPETVESMMLEVLTTRASRLYNVDLTGDPTQTGTLAEAIRLTDRAENYGPIESLSYERELASLYLNAIAAIEADNHATAIRRLRNITDYQRTYKGIDLNRLLFEEYVAYGDAFYQYDRDYCRAVQQYDAALRLFTDANVQSRRDQAERYCQQGTAGTGTPGPGSGGSNVTPVAPVGQPDG